MANPGSPTAFVLDVCALVLIMASLHLTKLLNFRYFSHSWSICPWRGGGGGHLCDRDPPHMQRLPGTETPRPRPPSHIYRSGRYTSYWNAFLCGKIPAAQVLLEIFCLIFLPSLYLVGLFTELMLLQRGRSRRYPLRTKIFSVKLYIGAPLLEGWRPLLQKSWIRPCILHASER